MEGEIGLKREEIAELCRRHRVRRLALFGSAVGEEFGGGGMGVVSWVPPGRLWMTWASERRFQNPYPIRRATRAGNRRPDWSPVPLLDVYSLLAADDGRRSRMRDRSPRRASRAS